MNIWRGPGNKASFYLRSVYSSELFTHPILSNIERALDTANFQRLTTKWKFLTDKSRGSHNLKLVI